MRGNLPVTLKPFAMPDNRPRRVYNLPHDAMGAKTIIRQCTSPVSGIQHLEGGSLSNRGGRSNPRALLGLIS